MPSGRRFTWVPPQRNTGESTRHYVMVLQRQMRALKLIFEDEHNNRELHQCSRNRYDKCLALRDEAETPK